ncbi:MAG: M48 family metalloprotease, partial [Deltaproteobacteria bacterium]|nr:M48 family metalloprotease [Deltaproteobacteria bacterium]
EGQLAAIIAHEIGHVTQRHTSKGLERNRAVSIATLGGVLAGILLGGAPGAALMMGAVGGGIQAQLAYSREDEQEADIVGLGYLTKAGYDPQFMAGSFNSMLKGNYTSPKNVPTYLTTHPGLTERIGMVEAGIKAHPAYGNVFGRGDEKAFSAVRDRVMATVNDTSRAKNYFNTALKKGAENGSPHYGLALVYQREQSYDTAIREFKLALKADPANAGYLTDYGYALYLRKEYPAAIEALSRALVMRPNSTAILFTLGRIYEESGALDQAQLYYERTVVQDPGYAQALQQLGILYGRKGDMARAHLHTGLYFKVEGQFQKAVYHLNKAKESADQAPSDVKKRIDDALLAVEEEKKILKIR